MPSSITSQQNNPIYQGMGAQFDASATAHATPRTREMARDLQRIVANENVQSKQASTNPTRTSSKTKSDGDGFIDINRRTTNLNKSQVAHSLRHHANHQGHSFDIAPPMQRWKIEGTSNAPWSNVKQVKADGGPKTTTRSHPISNKSSSTAATKGSSESHHRR